MNRSGAIRAYGYAWITLALFLFSLAGHWIFGWFAYADEQKLHRASADPAGYIVEMGRDTLENWQSEFLQLLWQVGGLACFLYVGSPQSKEGDDRHEAKLDAIIRRLAPAEADRIIREIDNEFLRR
jgi:cbb3-type cytochrome oxidase subunit 3